MLGLLLTAGTLRAGGSGFNVIVVVNQTSFTALKKTFGWTNGVIEWSRTDFETCLRNPLLAMLASRGLTNQAEFVLLSMDVPYRVKDGDGSRNSGGG